MTFRLAVGVAAVSLMISSIYAQNGGQKGMLLVAEKGAQSLAIVDPVQRKVLDFRA